MTRQVMVGEGTEAGMPAKLESLFCHNLLGLPSLSFIHFFSHKRNNGFEEKTEEMNGKVTVWVWI